MKQPQKKPKQALLDGRSFQKRAIIREIWKNPTFSPWSQASLVGYCWGLYGCRREIEARAGEGTSIQEGKLLHAY